MTIAVCVTVVASRRLRAALAGAAALHLAGAVLIGLAPARFALAPFLVVIFLVTATCLLHAAVTSTTTRRLDLSEAGALRLTVQRHREAGAPVARPVTLAAGSVAWPRLLLLRLRTEGGTCLSVPVLPDSADPSAFRALARALRALAGRATSPVGRTD